MSFLERVKLNSPVSAVVYGCAHCPLMDKDAENGVLGLIAEKKPTHVFMIGDLFEADSASKWPSEYTWTLEDEYRIADEHLRRIRAASGGAKLVFIPGNHDDNLIGMFRLDNKIRSRCDWRTAQYDKTGRWLNEELLTHWSVPTQYVYDRLRGCVRVGQVVLAHGYRADASASKFQAIKLANEYGLFVSAHTHRPEDVTQVQMTQACSLRYWFANVGCTRDMYDVPYMSRKDRFRWGNAALWFEAEALKSPRAGRRWNAEVRIFKMFDGE